MSVFKIKISFQYNMNKFDVFTTKTRKYYCQTQFNKIVNQIIEHQNLKNIIINEFIRNMSDKHGI